MSDFGFYAGLADSVYDAARLQRAAEVDDHERIASERACASCGAQPGDVCTDRTGAPMSSAHAVRLTAKPSVDHVPDRER